MLAMMWSVTVRVLAEPIYNPMLLKSNLQIFHMRVNNK